MGAQVLALTVILFYLHQGPAAEASFCSGGCLWASANELEEEFLLHWMFLTVDVAQEAVSCPCLFLSSGESMGWVWSLNAEHQCLSHVHLQGMCVSCSNSDRSVSSYSVRWTCVCCWVDGTAQYLLSPPRHPTGSWLLPLSCSSQRLAFSTAFQAEFPEGCWNLESSWLSVLLIFLPSFFSSPFLLFHFMLLAF